ncbi:hypothetical protein [Catellatospora tritici]|uniref:hypothetical protein n=1 Tax=Catellatospora tritici TaxID=2851566 RepID=UPI001C2CDC27|nr:hypothetical protein [Catellatospora tritici]MBV1852860.1 hypothetical protein [Catellatospora tritici]
MTESVLLGEITSPSGELVLMDGGYLGLWSGDRSPDEVRQPDEPPTVDFEVVGPDAEAAARWFDRQSGRTRYDIPRQGAAQFVELFDGHCVEHGHRAQLRAFEQRVPHRARVRHAIAGGESDFLISGVPVVSVGGLPTDRAFPVTAVPDPDSGWAHLRIQVGDRPVTGTRELGRIGVDWARFVFADADALSGWIHDDPVDGLADVVFWGLHQAEVAAEFGASRTGTPGDDNFGWLNLPIAEAYAKAVALDERRTAAPQRRFAFDFRPHSHHWQVMAGVRASEHEAATIEVGGARVMFAMTSIGDGFFPVYLDHDVAGAPVAIRITIQGDDQLHA